LGGEGGRRLANPGFHIADGVGGVRIEIEAITVLGEQPAGDQVAAFFRVGDGIGVEADRQEALVVETGHVDHDDDRPVAVAGDAPQAVGDGGTGDERDGDPLEAGQHRLQMQEGLFDAVRVDGPLVEKGFEFGHDAPQPGKPGSFLRL